MTTTTKNTAANLKITDIVFRNKFKALLNDSNRNTILHVFRSLLTLSEQAALEVLWYLTITPDCQFNRFRLTADLFSLENAIPLRNELRYQYELRHPHFLDIDIPETCRNAFEALKNKTDSIVAATVYHQCLLMLFLDIEEINRSLFLLNHADDSYYYGGIRSLDFTKPASQYLKPFHMQIHDLLKVMLEDKLQNALSAEGSESNKPLSNLAALIEDAGMKLAPNEQTTDTGLVVSPATPPDTKCNNSTDKKAVQTEPMVEHSGQTQRACHCNTAGYVQLTAEAVLSHKKLFDALLCSDVLSTLLLLHDSGFDLNEIIKKEVKIRSLLQLDSDLNM